MNKNANDYVNTIEKLSSEYMKIYNSSFNSFGRHIDIICKSSWKKRMKLLKRTFQIKRGELLLRHNVKGNESIPLYWYSGEPESKRGVVYTCITSRYDIPKEPFYSNYGVDFCLFSDIGNVSNNSKWVTKPISDNIDNALANRFCKLNPFSLFDEDYDYCIYIDGNIRIVSEIRDLYTIARESKSGIAMHTHPSRNNIFDEAQACLFYQKGKPEQIKKLVKSYDIDGCSKDTGLWEASIIVTDLKNENAKKIFEAWWNEFCFRDVGRDQIIFPYVLWKLGFEKQDVGFLGNNEHLNPKFWFYGHE